MPPRYKLRTRPGIAAPAWTRPVVATAAAVALALLCGCSKDRAPRPTSVILISIDTLRADHVGCLGYERDTTPTLDQIAKDGALFRQHISNTSWTLPSHVSMLTGLPDTLHGVQSDDRLLDPARTTLAEILKDRGYRTAGFYSGPYLHPTYGLGQGFDVYDSAIVLERPPDKVAAWDRINDTDRFRLIARHSYQTITGPELALRSTAWLDSVTDDEPFFLFVHFFDCHWDYMAPESYWRPFDPDYDDPDFDGREFISNEDIRPDMPPHRLRNLIARYDGEIRFTDEMVRRLIAHLERIGRSDDTLVVITSDHGEEFFEHGKKGHRNNLFDESLRIPLVIRGPGVPGGVLVEAQTSIIDVAPTILDLLSLPPGPEMAGRRLTRLLRADPPEELTSRTTYGRLVIPEADIHARFSRTAQHKLISSRAGATTSYEDLQYYDLIADKQELAPRIARSDGEGPREAEGANGHPTHEDVLRAYKNLKEHDDQQAASARQLPREAEGKGPQIDAALREMLRQNGYLGDGDR